MFPNLIITVRNGMK